MWDNAKNKARQIKGLSKATNSTNDNNQTVRKIHTIKVASNGLEEAIKSIAWLWEREGNKWYDYGYYLSSIATLTTLTGFMWF